MIKYLKIFILILFLIGVQAETFIIDPSENAVDHNNYGLFYFRIDDYPAAIQEFKIAIALSPNAASTASFYNNLGLVYLKIRRYSWAISCFKISVQKSPNFIEYYINLAKAYKGTKSLSAQANRYKKIVNKNKDDYTAWLMLGLIYKELNKKNDALNFFNEFKKSGPDQLLESSVNNIINSMQ